MDVRTRVSKPAALSSHPAEARAYSRQAGRARALPARCLIDCGLVTSCLQPRLWLSQLADIYTIVNTQKSRRVPWASVELDTVEMRHNIMKLLTSSQ